MSEKLTQELAAAGRVDRRWTAAFSLWKHCVKSGTSLAASSHILGGWPCAGEAAAAAGAARPPRGQLQPAAAGPAVGHA